jgi:hypothetical protein
MTIMLIKSIVDLVILNNFVKFSMENELWKSFLCTI